MKFKTRLIALLGLLAFSTASFAQNNISSNDLTGLPSSFFQRWKLDYGEMEGTRISGLPESPGNDYLFKTNGEYYLYDSNQEYVIGYWKYNASEKTIYTERNNGTHNSKIINITENSFTLVPSGKGVEGTMFENLRLYYIIYY